MGRRFENFKQKVNQKCEEWEAEIALPEEEVGAVSAHEWLEKHPASQEAELYRPLPIHQPALVGHRAIQGVNIWDRR